MLHIVLALLKIIGIILASILGLILVLILIVLFVPVRYAISADNLEELRAEGKISWLFRLLYVRVTFLNNRLVIRLRLFGKLFYDSSKPAEKKQEYEKGILHRIKKPVKKTGIKRKETKEKSGKKNVGLQKEVNPAEISRGQGSIKSTEVVKTQDQGSAEIIHEDTGPDLKAAELTGIPQKEARAARTEKTAVIKPDKPEAAGGTIDSGKEFENEVTEENPKGIINRIKRFFRKIRDIFLALRNWFKNLKTRVRNLREKITDIGGKWDKIKTFLRADENKAAFSKAFVTAKRIFRHVRPARLKLELEFGTGDPCFTGQVLGVLAMFYGYYGKSMQVIPNFEEEVLEGSIFCSGRIRLFTLLIICIQLILDKNFKNLLKNFKALKEDL